MKHKLQNALLGGMLLGMGIMLTIAIIFAPPPRWEGVIPWYVIFPFFSTYVAGGFFTYAAFRNVR